MRYLLICVLCIGGCHAFETFPERPGGADATSDGMEDMADDVAIDLSDMSTDVDFASDAADACGEFRPPRSALVRGISTRQLPGETIDSLAFVAAPADDTTRLTWFISGPQFNQGRQLVEVESEGRTNDIGLGLSQTGTVAFSAEQYTTRILATARQMNGCWSNHSISVLASRWQDIVPGAVSNCEPEPIPLVAHAGGYNPWDGETYEAFDVWISPTANTLISRGDSGDLEVDLGTLEVARPLEVYSTTGALIFFRARDGEIYAWDAEQPGISRVIIGQQPAGPFALRSALQRPPRHFDVVHLREDVYLFVTSGPALLELVEARYEPGQGFTVNRTRTHSPANNPRWPTLALARDYVVLSYFDSYAPDASGRAYQLARWQPEEGIDWVGEPYRSQSDPSMVVAIESAAYRDGCDLVAGVLEVSGNVGRSYEVFFPEWQNAYEQP